MNNLSIDYDIFQQDNTEIDLPMTSSLPRPPFGPGTEGARSRQASCSSIGMTTVKDSFPPKRLFFPTSSSYPVCSVRCRQTCPFRPSDKRRNRVLSFLLSLSFLINSLFIAWTFTSFKPPSCFDQIQFKNTDYNFNISIKGIRIFS